MLCDFVLHASKKCDVLLEQDGTETRVEGTDTLVLQDLGETADETVGEGGLGDETDTGGLQGAEGDVGEELGGGRGGEVDGSAVVLSILVADEVDALFGDDDDSVTDLAEMTSGVSLSAGDRPTQSMPPSPTRNGTSGQPPHRTSSDSQLKKAGGDAPESKLSDKEKYLSMFTLREDGGEYIQEVREMTRVPIILKTDLSKSPPYAVSLLKLS